MLTLRIKSSYGFTIIELLIAALVFPIIVAGLYNAAMTVKASYTVSRQLNEIYAVLSACPELDRALEFSSISEDTDCFPNNIFVSEGSGGSTIVYDPLLSINETSDLSPDDSLYAIPDSKVIDISVEFPNQNATEFALRMLVARNGIGQQ
jgi:prepilin-type N-terminal cleavage/methylation domain-containing protein